MMKLFIFLLANFLLLIVEKVSTAEDGKISDTSIPEKIVEEQPRSQYYWPPQQQQGFYPNGAAAGGQYSQYPIQYPGQYPGTINGQYPPYGQNGQYPVSYPGQYPSGGQSNFYPNGNLNQQFLPNSQGFYVPATLVTLGPLATVTPLPLQDGVSTTAPLGAGNGFQRPTNQNLYPGGGGVSGGNSQNIFPGQPGFGGQYGGFYQG